MVGGGLKFQKTTNPPNWWYCKSGGGKLVGFHQETGVEALAVHSWLQWRAARRAHCESAVAAPQRSPRPSRDKTGEDFVGSGDGEGGETCQPSMCAGQARTQLLAMPPAPPSPFHYRLLAVSLPSRGKQLNNKGRARTRDRSHAGCVKLHGAR